MIEHRKKERKGIDLRIVVSDALLSRSLGRVVNVSDEGFMIIGDGLINENCIYQLILEIEGEGASPGDKVALGAECLWISETGSGTQHWAGFHIIDIAENDLQKMLSFADRH